MSSDAARNDVQAIINAYTPASPSYRFNHLFLNRVDNPASRVRPAGVDELRWRQALAAAGGADNAQHLWPVQAQGFKDLVLRMQARSFCCKNAGRFLFLSMYFISIAVYLRRHDGA